MSTGLGRMLKTTRQAKKAITSRTRRRMLIIVIIVERTDVIAVHRISSVSSLRKSIGTGNLKTMNPHSVVIPSGLHTMSITHIHKMNKSELPCTAYVKLVRHVGGNGIRSRVKP